MATYTAVGHVAASVSEDVEADSPEEAAQRAVFNFSLCHACSRELEAGDVFDVEVLDENGEVVLESEHDQELEKLHARIRELEVAAADLPEPWVWDGDAVAMHDADVGGGKRIDVVDGTVEVKRWLVAYTIVSIPVDVMRALLARYDSSGGERG